MENFLTFSMLKPEVVKDNNIGNVLAMIEKADFEILACKLTQISLAEAKQFYLVHKERPFYEELCEYISHGPVLALVLKKDNAVKDFRNLIGATNPLEAAEGTIRAKYGKSIDLNAVHGSDSDENAQIEIKFFFCEREVLTK